MGLVPLSFSHSLSPSPALSRNDMAVMAAKKLQRYKNTNRPREITKGSKESLCVSLGSFVAKRSSLIGHERSHRTQRNRFVSFGLFCGQENIDRWPREITQNPKEPLCVLWALLWPNGALCSLCSFVAKRISIVGHERSRRTQKNHPVFFVFFCGQTELPNWPREITQNSKEPPCVLCVLLWPREFRSLATRNLREHMGSL
jgi:hypothetical protein